MIRERPERPEGFAIEFAGEWYAPDPSRPFTIGREADLVVDENPYLHRQLAVIQHADGVWWLSNVGSSIALSLSADDGVYQAWAGPGVRVPLVFARLAVVFTAGAYTYEFVVHQPEPAWQGSGLAAPAPSAGDTTIGRAQLTESQRLLVLVLAEPLLRDPGGRMSSIPSSAAAAERLGWPVTTFNRKLDAVCDKLDRAGVPGLRGGIGNLATQRKARLVEHAVLSRMVTAADLPVLDLVVESAAQRARDAARAASKGPAR